MIVRPGDTLFIGMGTVNSEQLEELREVLTSVMTDVEVRVIVNMNGNFLYRGHEA